MYDEGYVTPGEGDEATWVKIDEKFVSQQKHWLLFR